MTLYHEILNESVVSSILRSFFCLKSIELSVNIDQEYEAFLHDNIHSSWGLLLPS